MNIRPQNPIGLLTALAVVSGSVVASAEISSKDHPVINRTLKTYPDSDTNKDGLLTYAEYRAFVDKPGSRKQADGRPAGPISTVLPNGDMVISDFEENNFGRLREWGWTIDGNAFNRDLNAGTRIMKRRAGSYQGKYFLTSFVGSDGNVGQIQSPPFGIELKYIEFQMSGGDYPHRVCVNLLVDGKVVRTATGQNDDLFEAVAFDVSGFRGRTARWQIVDAQRGIWGHINVDRVYQTDKLRAKRVITAAPADFGESAVLVQTADGKQLRGPLAIKAGKLTIRNQPLALDSLLLAVSKQRSDRSAAGSAVRLVNGETWNAKIISLAKNKVLIENPLIGQREVPVSQIARLEFLAGSAGAAEPGTLYRTRGEPIPGKLVWIRANDIAIDCPLGVVPLPRATVQRFVAAAIDPKAKRGTDEIGLADGSLFFGQLSVEEDKLLLTHPTLGPLRFAWEAVSYVQRTPEGIRWLDRLSPTEVDRLGPVLAPPPPTVVESSDAGFLRAVRMLPRTVARYRLPDGGDGFDFRAQLAPVGGSSADVTVKIRAGNRDVWQKRIAANGKPIPVAINLSGAKELTIEVDFGERLAFPSGVNWFDAHLVKR